MIGTKLAHYDITAHLGSGGMGEVYQATDTKLGRSVAIKFLPETFSHDQERVARFQREARVLASLNHPNIAAIHGVEESGKRKFLVMELATGETLADRIARGPLPMDEALAIAKQIAEALEAAHEKGIIHRDLKPANIKVSHDGVVKVLDFGLAKASGAEAPDVSLSSSPTMAVAGTNAGMLLGTAAYMSPEQARGMPLDRRTDISSFGAVLFEMLTGRQAFPGETAGDILAAVIRGEPDWNLLPPETPAGIRRLLRRCLEKNPKARLHDMADVRIEIDDAQGTPVVQVSTPAVSSDNRKLAWLLVSALALLAIAEGAWIGLRPAAPSSEMWVELTTPPTTDAASFALSPDGRSVVFVASSEGRERLWLRQLDSASSRVLQGTDDASFPFWSHDNRSVGFFAEGKLKRIEIDGGLVQTVANASVGRGASWGKDGTIVFAPTAIGAIFSVPATGGNPVAVTQLEPQAQTNHTFPWFLPDGKHFLYYAAGTPQGRGVYVGNTDGSPGKRLLESDSAAAYSTSGHILFVRQATLFAQSFNPSNLEASGNPVPIAAQTTGRVSPSAAGPIAFRTGTAVVQRQFVWLDRTGTETGRIGEPVGGGMRNPALSPDGKRLAVDRNNDIFLLDLGRGEFNRFTLEPTSDVFPIWSKDGTRIVWDSNRTGPFDLYVKAATGAGNEVLIYGSPETKAATDISPDERFLLYRASDPSRTYDIWALPVDGQLLKQRDPYPVVQTEFEERDAQFSPDGKWIAYQSNQTGRSEIYVQRFSETGEKVTGKWQVSMNGGAQVRWNPTGGELFYIGLDARLMAAPIRLTAESVEVGTAVPLFVTNVGGAVQGINRPQYVVSADGKRFLMNVITSQTTPPITLVLNWKPSPK